MKGKLARAKAASGTYVFNERKILDASHVVVFWRENRDGRRLAAARGGSGRGRWPFRHPGRKSR